MYVIRDKETGKYWLYGMNNHCWPNNLQQTFFLQSPTHSGLYVYRECVEVKCPLRRQVMEDTRNMLNLGFSLENLKYLANRIARDRGGYVSLAVEYENKGNGDVDELKFYLTVPDDEGEFALGTMDYERNRSFLYSSWNELVDDWG